MEPFLSVAAEVAPGSGETMRFADVLIEDLPASAERNIYTYAVPSDLQSRVQLGAQVAIPFGAQTRLGFVISFHHTPPDSQVREIQSVTARQFLDPPYFEWLQWIADYYLSSLSQVLATAIPRRTTGRMRTLVKPTLPAAEFVRVMEERFTVTYPELIDFGKYLISSAPAWKTLRSCRYKFRHHKDFIKQLQLHHLVEVSQEIEEAPQAREQLFVTYSKEVRRLSARQDEILGILRKLGGHILASELCRQANTTMATLRRMATLGALDIASGQLRRQPLPQLGGEYIPKLLTREQDLALSYLRKCLVSPPSEPVVLLHGVTGSGKTEVYLQILKTVLDDGGGGIVLVPEISLTPMMLGRFREVFGDQVAVIHSGLSTGEYRDEWERIQQGISRVVIGARSAIFAPVRDLKLVIIDEEHETTYKQENLLRYDARLLAIERIRRLDGLVILGSATPRVESYYRAQRGIIGYQRLAKRVHQRPLPPVQIIDMRLEREQGNNGIYSHFLKETMHQALARDEQIILLLNRRGYANSMLCRSCGDAIACPLCDVSLTYHKDVHALKCHYCDHLAPVPEVCPVCRSPAIQTFGLGTQKLEQITEQLFPEAKILRMDRDTTSKKNAHFRILRQFDQGKADILIGTQMVAKGLDFHRVTVVGLLAADMALNLPDFRAAERTFQLLTQAAGRAGRGELKSQIVLQTYAPEHPAIQAALQHDYQALYDSEVGLREQFHYPPYTALIKVVFAHPRQGEAMQVAQYWTEELNALEMDNLHLLGPFPSPIARIQTLYRIQLLIKYPQPRKLHPLLKRLRYETSRNLHRLVIDMDPYSML